MDIKKVISCLLVVGISFLLSQHISAMDIPVLKNIQVASTIEYDESTALYKYSYAVSNPATNTGQIFMVDIDISKPPQSQELNAKGLILYKGLNWRGEMLQVSFEDKLASIGSRMDKPVLPIGAQPPSGWSFDISLSGTASWGSRNKTYRIMPGQLLDGYIMISSGVPSIREVSVIPKWVLVVDDYVSEEDIAKSNQIKEEITYKTKTIGPTAPPAELVPLDFLENVISMKHEAVSLGWIKNKGVENSLDAKLENARKKIEQGNIKAAKNILGAFINEVEAQGCESYADCPGGKHLKPEAYALLKYNARYLIDNLK